ncbi:MAG: gliding motility-associated ABC transporter substrate-binding protein GldG [Bacteroidales bacterium]|nr:gliding motility-associated ABC transporter substrate-binding protein GldG [Bacteroidales bacterium]
MNRKHLRNKHLLQLVAVFLAVVVVAALSSAAFFRVDLTSEKRYTLSRPSKELLKELDDVVLIRVYLDGELPGGFVQFRQSIRELLDEFRAYGGNRIQYTFVNLYDESDPAVRQRMITELYNMGLNVTNVMMRDREGGKTDRIIFPGAILSYRGYEIPVNLLKNNPALSHEVNLNNSVQALEYEFIRAIQSLTVKEIPMIAFIEGHGELDSLQTHSIMNELRNFFQVDRGHINGNLEALLNYRAIIIAQPTRPFSERDRFAIDQYIMRGGNVLFFLDPVISPADSLQSRMTYALANPVGLEDLLFKYGIRIDYNLAVDMQCNLVPVNVAPAGQQAEFRMMPWIYLPLLSGPQDHPVTRSLNYVKTEFVSVLDTLDALPGDVKKTAILTTSPNSNRMKVPLQIRMEEITRELNPAFFSQSGLPVGVLLEGSFPSFYKNYAVPGGVTPPDAEIIASSRPASVFVSGDGDMIRNEVEFSGGRYVARPLGYDKYSRQTFGNREFILNLVNYMTDQSGIMELRSREFRLRLLDQEMINDRGRRIFWVLFNTVLPPVLLALSGAGFYYRRRKKYGG